MTAAAPGKPIDKPPATTHILCTPGAAASPTTRRRPLLHPVVALGPADGIDVRDPGARRQWVALVGPSAVADLMRLVTAARRGTSVPEPSCLSVLLAWDLVRWENGHLCVLSPIPGVPVEALHRMQRRARLRLGA